ncbi:MAG: zf-HC2 domain-containing protein [Clostridia bacterium]|nr:zf-HC2 domain-containing protein [Clostridia bacterium]
MKNECSIVRDLLPLYLEDMVCPETADYVKAHLEECAECRSELEGLKEGSSVSTVKQEPAAPEAEAKPFKKIMKRMNRQFDSLAYSAIIFFIFLGFGWTGGENLMYNSLIMPIVGIFGYYVFRWKAVYKVPALLLVIDMFVCLFKLIEIDLLSAFLWTLIYSGFVFIGIAIAFLLHYAFRKENN